MKTIKIIAFALIVSVTAIAVKSIIPAFVHQKSITEMISINDDYPKLWAKVDSLVNKGLTRSAIEVVQVIYEKAKIENHTGNFVKAVTYKLRLESYISEDDYVKEINDLTKEASEAKFPIKPVIHSMIAEVYWKYYQTNRYKFLNRTETVDFVPEDIRTWDLRKIVEQSIKYYQLSLEDAVNLKKTSINVYDEILVKQGNDSKNFRPTLYDFLAHRAIDFFANEEPGLVNPVNRFEIDKEDYFAPYDKYINFNITTTDNYSLTYYAATLFQGLLDFHKNDSDPTSLIDDDLKRLDFMRQKSIHPDKDTLYIQALESLSKKFETFPSSSEVIYKIANYYYAEGNSYASTKDEADRWKLKKAYTICDIAIRKFPDAFGSKNCKCLQQKIKEKSLSLTTENVNVPGKPFRSLLSYQNLNKVYVRICKTSYEWYDKLAYQYYYDDKFIKPLLKLTPTKQFSIDLTNPQDYQGHSTEIKMPELDPGFYVVLVGTDEGFTYTYEAIAYSSIWVSNISYLKRALTNGNTQFVVLNRQSGQPIQGVSAQVYNEVYSYSTRRYEYHAGARYTSNEEGMFEVFPVNNNNYNNSFIEFNYGNDKLKSTNFYTYKPYKYDNKKYLRTIFFTDRMIYRPGQTIYFKGILLETDGETTEIKPATETNVVLYDVNYQKVSEVKLTSNEFGTFSGSFLLPTGSLNGQMRIADAWGNIYFSVEEYKRPKFEVSFEPVKGTYKLGEKVTVKGIAAAYAGSNIDNAQVKYRVVRTARFPYWWYYWYGYYPNSPQMEIINGTTTTNDKGEFSVEFTAIPDYKVSKKSDPTFSYQIIADVTDINGETRSSQTYVNAGYKALLVSVDMPGEIEKSNKDPYAISTTNLSGNYEYAKGRIVVHKLKQPEKLFRSRLWQEPDMKQISKNDYYQWFPYDQYENETNTSKWAKGGQILEYSFDTGQDSLLKIPDLPSWPSGQYVLEINSIDKFGEKVQSFSYFTVYSNNDKTIPVNDFAWFSTLKAKGEPGEEAAFLIGTKEQNISVLMEVEIRNNIIQKQWIKLNNELKKITVPIKEEYRGNFAVHFTFVCQSRVYQKDVSIEVPYTNKELDISFETFRNKLIPGQSEEWKIKIKGKNGEKVAAEMLAGMYDASLDAYRANSWLMSLYNYYYMQRSWESYNGFSTVGSNLYSVSWNPYVYFNYHTYDYLNWFGYDNYYYSYQYRGYYDDYYDYDRADQSEIVFDGVATTAKGSAGKKKDAKAEMGNLPSAVSFDVTAGEKTLEENEISGNSRTSGGLLKPGNGPETGKDMDLGDIKTRTNFAETAFFYPHLLTNENGEIVISFTVPEALTKWKFMGLAHTKDLKYSQIQKEVLTQKDLMVMPNPPRFFRENDKIVFSSKITNLSADSITAYATLMLFNAETQQPIDILTGNTDQIKCVGIPKGQSKAVEWSLSIPENIPAITYKVVAKAGNFSDGEEMVVPVLTNRMLVTETMPLPIRGNQIKNFNFEKLINAYKSNTLKNYKLTLEFTSNPSWYAVQALPYLIEYPYECTEQIFSRFYANSIASFIANSNPKIREVFDSWKNITPEALLSNLEKNQDLKYVMLQETPWVLQAKNESQSKRNIGILLEEKRMKNEIERALKKLEKLQVSNGGWTWFPGMPDDRYITQHIITGFCHLDKLGVRDVRDQYKVWNMVKRGSRYLDDRIREDYEWLLRYDPEHMFENHLGGIQIQYLYARSYFIKDIPVETKNKKAFDYYFGQAKKYWLPNNRYLQGMIALAMNRLDDKGTATDIVKSLKENAIFSEEMGMYWKDMDYGYYWYQAPIETQALLIECFDEVANDKQSVEDMKVWLLKQKQTQNWKSTKATAEACFALLLRGTDWLAKDPQVSITLGGMLVDPKNLPDVKQQAGTGYFRTSWFDEAIKPEMGKVKVSKSDDGVAWGALYWQYFEQLDKITPAETPLKIVKKLFVERNSDHGPVITPISDETKLKLGDKIKVRIELRVDRDMEYIHMKDMRASGFEPINVISQYKYQGGLGYYESTGDAATNFFISYLKKGTYVFEYPLRVAQKGDFSNGITSIQCMYAPEFSAHSEGIRVKVSG
ncbi:MAG TPA: alpha-2-macroglobulin family protein [Bacteroidales bacterium]|nr:alpha-2-macroglobulin family protein [Bacteroidales bacterium]